MSDENKSLDETNEQQTEQRSDDYDGLARRIDDVIEKVNMVVERLDKVDSLSDALSNFLDHAPVEKNNESSSDEVVEREEDMVDDIDLTTPLEELNFDLD